MMRMEQRLLPLTVVMQHPSLAIGSVRLLRIAPHHVRAEALGDAHSATRTVDCGEASARVAGVGQHLAVVVVRSCFQHRLTDDDGDHVGA